MTLFDRLEARRAFTGEESLLIANVRRLAGEVIAPRAAEYDASAAFPWDNIAALNALGLNGVFIPEAEGGHPISFRAYLAVVQTIAEACAATGIIYATNFHAMKPLIDFGTAPQRQGFLPRIAAGGLGALAITESGAGSDATGMTTRFVADGDSIVIDGAKLFITSGDVADLILLFGKWSEIDDSRAAISALIVEKDTPGFSVTGTEDKMGHRASGTAALAFDSCRVPRANLLGAPGDGLAILFSALNKSRPSVAAHALGIATAAFKDLTAYVNGRVQSGQRIVDFQATQFLIADLAAELALCESWLDHVAALVEAGEDGIAVEASIAKLRASDLAMRMASEAVQMHGGYGYVKGHRAERLMRDAKITQIWEGTNQIHRQLIGRAFRDR